MKISTIRGIVACALIVGLTIVGLVINAGTGTASAWGIGAISAICPLGALESFLGAKNVGVHALICLAIVVVAIVLVGKAFCSWACPIPWLQRFFKHKQPTTSKNEASSAKPEPSKQIDAPLKTEVFKHVESSTQNELSAEEKTSLKHAACSTCKTCALMPVGGKRDGVQIDGRHVVLGGALLSSLAFGFPVFCLICPVGLSFATLIGIWHLFQFNETTWGLIIFPLILLIEILILKRWCFSFCPISALSSLISRANVFFKPHVDNNRCLRQEGHDCQVCVQICPEKVDPHNAVIPECSKCHLCAEACPAQAISFPFYAKKESALSRKDTSDSSSELEPSAPNCPRE